VVEPGETGTLPDAPNVPTPAIVTEVALGTFQESVEVPPETMDGGDEEKLEPATAGH
jgi:hypothetical protein